MDINHCLKLSGQGLAFSIEICIRLKLWIPNVSFSFVLIASFYNVLSNADAASKAKVAFGVLLVTLARALKVVTLTSLYPTFEKGLLSSSSRQLGERLLKMLTRKSRAWIRSRFPFSHFCGFRNYQTCPDNAFSANALCFLKITIRVIISGPCIDFRTTAYVSKNE